MNDTICPNCGEARPNAFCGYCGQNSRDYNASLWAILRDAIGELFEFDGRVIRSLRSIVRYPGQLSLAFAENRRANFVNPFRLFIFTTIFWFFLFGVTLPSPADRPIRSYERLDVDETEQKRLPERIRVSMEIDSEAQEQTAVEIAAGLEILRSHLEGDRIRKLDDLLVATDEPERSMLVTGIAQLLNASPGMPQWLQRVLANLVVDLNHSPQLLLNELIDNLPLMMVVLLPWYAVLLMVFFGRRGKRFIHHLVFAIHVHAFSFIVLSVVLLTPGQANPVDKTWWTQAWDSFDRFVFIALMVHTYFAFRRFYGQGHIRTFVKYFSLGFFYLWGLFPAFSFVLVLLLTDYL